MTCLAKHPADSDVRCERPKGHGGSHHAKTSRVALDWSSDYFHSRRLPAALIDGSGALDA